MRVLLLTVALAAVSHAWAEGPGSRIGTTPEVPIAPRAPAPATAADAKRCESLTGERREKCLADLRIAPGARSSGPQSIGGGAGTGAGASSGTTGGATFGGSAPR
jgi:hypothetical protein